MKDSALSYNRETSYINKIFISPDIELVVLYTHFMKNSKNTWNFGVHSHSFNELHIVLGGSCKMNLGDGELSLSEHEAVLVPAGTEHRFIEKSDDLFRFSVAINILHGKSRVLVPEPSVLKLNPKCDTYLETVLTEFDENKIGCKNIIDSTLQCLVIEILRQMNIFYSPKYVTNTNLHFYEALQFIDSNISHKITAADVAEEVFFSVRQLNRIFSANLNMTVSQYIKAKKLDNSKKFLRETGLKIKEIAFLTGFDDESSFCKFFKKELGIPPARYRISQSE